MMSINDKTTTKVVEAIDKTKTKAYKRYQAREDGVFHIMGGAALMFLITAIIFYIGDGPSLMAFISMGMFALILISMVSVALFERKEIYNDGHARDKTINNERNAAAIQIIACTRFYEPYAAAFGVPEKPLQYRAYDTELEIYIDYSVWVADECLKILPKWHAKTVTAYHLKDIPETLDLSESYKLTEIPLADIEYFVKAEAPPSIAQPKGGRKTVLATRGGSIDYPATAFEVFTRLFPDKSREMR